MTQDGNAAGGQGPKKKGRLHVHFRHDGFYALAIKPADRDNFTLNVRGQLYGLAGLTMGWSLSLFYFCKMTPTFANFLRAQDPILPSPAQGNCTKTPTP